MLPVELIENVLLHLHHDNAIYSLKQCARVSSTLRDISQSHLFARIELIYHAYGMGSHGLVWILDPRDLAGVKVLEVLNNSLRLCSLVKSLQIRSFSIFETSPPPQFASEFYTRWSPFDNLSEDSELPPIPGAPDILIPRLSNLQTLCLHTDSVWPFLNPGIQRVILDACRMQLTHLVLDWKWMFPLDGLRNSKHLKSLSLCAPFEYDAPTASNGLHSHPDAFEPEELEICQRKHRIHLTFDSPFPLFLLQVDSPISLASLRCLRVRDPTIFDHYPISALPCPLLEELEIVLGDRQFERRRSNTLIVSDDKGPPQTDNYEDPPLDLSHFPLLRRLEFVSPITYILPEYPESDWSTDVRGYTSYLPWIAETLQTVLPETPLAGISLHFRIVKHMFDDTPAPTCQWSKELVEEIEFERICRPLVLHNEESQSGFRLRLPNLRCVSILLQHSVEDNAHYTTIAHHPGLRALHDLGILRVTSDYTYYMHQGCA